MSLRESHLFKLTLGGRILIYKMRLEEAFLHQESDELMKKALVKAETIIQRDQIRIDDFADLYGQHIIKRDKAYVEERKEHFRLIDLEEDSVRNKEWARVFEAILHEQGELSNWFGENATTIKTSDFDDFKGVDEIVEYKGEGSALSFLALAIDATYNPNVKTKLRKIREEIESGNLANIRYFAAENVDIRGELKKIPHVIVGADRATLVEISEMWIEGRSGQLSEHPIQFQILYEIFEQCVVFAKYARKIGRTEIAEKYEQTAKLIEAVLEDKKKKIKDTGKRDSVFSALQADLAGFGERDWTLF